jgi:hypothetical protein
VSLFFSAIAGTTITEKDAIWSEQSAQRVLHEFCKILFATSDEEELKILDTGYRLNKKTENHMIIRPRFEPRALFATKHGYLGLCAPGVTDGDRMCVVLGCDTPLIIRPTHDEKGSYGVVGPFFAYGVMDGEITVEQDSLKTEMVVFV